MCLFVIALLPAQCDIAKVETLARQHGRALSPLANPALDRQLGDGMHAYLTTPGHCDCGTVLGAARRLASTARDPEEEIRKRMRKGWSQAKAARAVAQQRDQENADAIDREELNRWLRFVDAMQAQLPKAGFGLLVHMADGAPDAPFECRSTAGTVDRDALETTLLSMEEEVLYRFGAAR